MSDQTLHPGIICAIVLIPAALLLFVTLIILKGFNLISQLCTCWRRPRRQRDEKHSQATSASLTDPTGGSFTTIESSFIGQARNESTATITLPPPVHHARQPVAGCRYSPSATYNQERKVNAGPPQQAQELQWGELRGGWT